MEIDEKMVEVDVRRYYEIEANHIKQVTGGTVGFTYAVNDTYFLKIYDSGLSMSQRCTEHVENQMAVLDYLQNNTKLSGKICYPIKTSLGKFFYEHDHVTGVLFNYIHGAAVGFENKYSLLDTQQISVIVEDLHHVDTSMMEALCPKEAFDLDWCDKLVSLMDKRCESLPNPFQEIVLENQSMIRMKIGEAYALAVAVKEMQLPFVLCHTDIHGGNLMRTIEGKLFLVDWENMMLGPRESDLFAFAEDNQLNHLAAGSNKTAIRYYTIRRDLEDIYEFLCAIANQEYSSEEQNVVFGHVNRILCHLRHA